MMAMTTTTETRSHEDTKHHEEILIVRVNAG